MTQDNRAISLIVEPSPRKYQSWLKNTQQMLARLAILGLALAACQPSTPGTAPAGSSTVRPSCSEFEDVTLGDQYSVGDIFMSFFATISVEEFEFGNGTTTNGGSITVVSEGRAGDSGNELQVNNANGSFAYPEPVHGLSLLFGEYGGNMNLEINGDFVNFDLMSQLDGTTVGNVAITVVGGLGNDTGTASFEGEIISFAVGGQELFIDKVCARFGLQT